MVLHGADVEDRHTDVVEVDGRAVHLPLAARQRVVQEQAAQVVHVHAVGQARAVGIPGHQVVQRLAFAQQVVVQPVRPHHVVGAQHLEGASHLPLVEVAAPPHQVLEELDLAFVDEERQLAGVGEVGLRRQQRHAGQRAVRRAPEGGCHDGQQRAAQAIARRMHARAGHDALDRVQRSAHAEVVVVVHAQVAVTLVGVLPGDREHRVALVDQVLDQRVVRRQVQHVVLHDPGRHDQHRLGMHGARAGLVLDQLHQPVAQHHAARRDGDVAAGLVALGAHRRQVARLAPQVFQRVRRAAQQVHAELACRALLHDRAGRDEVRRRHHVQPLACREAQHLLMVAAHARHADGGALPPLLA